MVIDIKDIDIQSGVGLVYDDKFLGNVEDFDVISGVGTAAFEI